MAKEETKKEKVREVRVAKNTALGGKSWSAGTVVGRFSEGETLRKAKAAEGTEEADLELLLGSPCVLEIVEPVQPAAKQG